MTNSDRVSLNAKYIYTLEINEENYRSLWWESNASGLLPTGGHTTVLQTAVIQMLFLPGHPVAWDCVRILRCSEL